MAAKRQSLRDRNTEAITTEAMPPEQVETATPTAEAAPVSTVETKDPAKNDVPVKAPAKATPTAKKTAPPVSAASEVTRLGIYLTAEQFTGAKAAYLADWINGGEANTFTRWIGDVLSTHAERSPQERVQRSKLRDRATERTGSSRSFNVPTAAVEQMRAAITADHGAGRWPSDSAWCGEAIDLATEDAKAKNGGSLPAPPARLPNRLTR